MLAECIAIMIVYSTSMVEVIIFKEISFYDKISSNPKLKQAPTENMCIFFNVFKKVT